MSSEKEEKPAVNFENQIWHPPVDEKVREAIAKLRHDLADHPSYKDNVDSHMFCDDQNLHRFLRARNFDHKKAFKLLTETLQWRSEYKPWEIRAEEIESEANSGKMVIKHKDIHGRPILVMDSSRENSKDYVKNVRHLVFQLERAKRLMNGEVEKYCLFIHFSRHSMSTSPPMKVSMETLKCLTDRYPEHLGNAVLHMPGFLFKALWTACSPFVDARTKQKIIFVRGDDSEASDNHKLLSKVIGPNWKELCNVGIPPEKVYNHEEFWPGLLKHDQEWYAGFTERRNAELAKLKQEQKAESEEHREEEKN